MRNTRTGFVVLSHHSLFRLSTSRDVGGFCPPPLSREGMPPYHFTAREKNACSFICLLTRTFLLCLVIYVAAKATYIRLLFGKMGVFRP